MSTDVMLHGPSALSPLEDCVQRAAQMCWAVEDASVILVNSTGTRERVLRTLFHAMGIEVFNGPDGADVGPQPVIVIDCETWRDPGARIRANRIRQQLPEAAMCIVNSVCPMTHDATSEHGPRFDDARALLRAGGFGFFSVNGGSHELTA